MQASLVVQYLVAGLTYGAIYAIVAIGFNIIYNATGIINFAQGEFVMLGGMIAITLQHWVPLPVAIAAAVLATMAIGAFIEVAFIRWLATPSVLRMIIITIGLSILIREAALLTWGESVRALPYFTGNEVSSIPLGGARVSPQVLWTLGACGVMVAVLTLFFQHTMVGRQMRACASNRVAASLCGHPHPEHGDALLRAERRDGRAGRLRRLADHLHAVRHRHGPRHQGVHRGHPGRPRQQPRGRRRRPGAGRARVVQRLVLPAAYKDAVSIAILLAILFVRPSGLFGAPQASRP